MTYFGVGLKRKVLELEVMVLMQVKSGHLDDSGTSYEILNAMKFCRFVTHRSCSNLEFNSVPNGTELGIVIYMKVLYLCLSFLKKFILLNLKACSLSYGSLSKESLNWNLQDSWLKYNWSSILYQMGQN